MFIVQYMYMKIKLIQTKADFNHVFLFVKQFFDVVDEFLEYRPNGLIGLHGADSINRPGYLIARYLIENYFWPPSDAIQVIFRALAVCTGGF